MAIQRQSSVQTILQRIRKGIKKLIQAVKLQLGKAGIHNRLRFRASRGNDGDDGPINLVRY